MNRDAHSHLRELRQLLPLTEENVGAFVSLFQQVADLQEECTIRALLELIDDRCSLGGVTDTLLTSLEVFPRAEYARNLLSVLPEFGRRNTLSCEQEIKKFLWSGETTLLLDASREASPESRDMLRSVLGRVAADVESLRTMAGALASNLR
jgi:hypothetical protein